MMLRSSFLLLGLLSHTAAFAAEATETESSRQAARLLVAGTRGLVRVELALAIDGDSAPMVWRRALDRLFEFHDRDGDGALTEPEARRLPTDYELRSLLWGAFLAPTGLGKHWEALDRDGDRRLTPDEVRQWYGRRGAEVTIGTGTAPDVAALNAALARSLDADRDGVVSRRELERARETLAPLDLNQDELVTPDELVAGTRYPGAAGTLRLQPWGSESGAASKEPAARPFRSITLLPLDLEGKGWIQELARSLTASSETSDPVLAGARTALGIASQGTSEETTLRERIRTLPSVPWHVVWEQGAPALSREASERLLPDAGLRLSLPANPGRLPAVLKEHCQRAAARFDEADTDRRGALTAQSPAVVKDLSLRRVLDVADRNGDAALSRAEHEAWLGLVRDLCAGQFLVTTLDLGQGVFELLDEDRDGRLAPPELRGAADRLDRLGVLSDGRLDGTRIPRHVWITVSHGHPESLVAVPDRPGPAWLKTMDRNQDGTVSRAEFLGEADQFAAIDRDGSGWIDAAEATAFRPESSPEAAP
ncbi:EF-hand domain-containing protein [Planctomyces sp. SH-PL14]|uniref:EF-hand domain-containing protein n=1 Tax=Planctomyces sp. SH-PL14 TaxID=1632864 RepID=UPI00078C0011|nr:EF-hand domain-containing protein [Planctomyces sp. SH-PL14]AMV19150.1 transaldolase/EF-hand domain-containing protein [Planctomyces sp. SH-PL14]